MQGVVTTIFSNHKSKIGAKKSQGFLLKYFPYFYFFKIIRNYSSTVDVFSRPQRHFPWKARIPRQRAPRGS
jgi:hypothetical protein